MSSKWLRVASILTAGVLFVRLSGLDRDHLPSASLLTVLLALLVVLETGIRRRSSGLAASLLGVCKRHRFGLVLAALAFLAVLVRLPHLSGDLGHSPLDVDEGRLAENVRHFFLTGEVKHETVEHYPGIAFWLLGGSSFVAFLRQVMQGTIRDIAGMSIESFVLAARAANVAIAAATVYATGLLGLELAGASVGLIGAALVAIAPLAIDTTTLARNDPGQTLFVTLAAYAALVAFRSSRSIAVLFAGALAGLAIGIKYTSVMVLAPVLLAPLLADGWPRPGAWRPRLMQASLALLACVAAVAVSNHFIWADFPNFLYQLSDQVDAWGTNQWIAGGGPAATRLARLSHEGPGAILLLLAAVTGAYDLGTGRPKYWVFWSFPLLYGALTMQREVLFPRWIYPFVPFVCVAGATGFVRALALLQTIPRTGRSLRVAVSAALIVIAFAQPIWSGTVDVSRRLAPLTYEAVEAWLAKHASGDLVLAQDGVLDLSKTGVRMHRVQNLGRELGSGLYALCANDWVVVPEEDRQNPNLRRLQFAMRVDGESRFGGSNGFDYQVFATPKLAPTPTPVDIRLETSDAAPFLGYGWPGADPRVPGLAVPDQGARLFLPPLTKDEVRLELDVEEDVAAAGIPLALTIGGSKIDLTGSHAAVNTTPRRFTALVALPNPGRVTELVLRPAAGVRSVRLMKVRIE